MNVGLYRGSAAMAVNERRLEAITSNLASVGSTSYKRVATAEHGRAVRGGETAGDRIQVDTFNVRDWSQGPLLRTAVPTDLALMGQGFFAVESPGGEVYTRDGHFFLTDAGQLMTEEGFPVAWDGVRGNLDPVGEPIRVDTAGNVFQGARRAGRLAIVDFPARDRLELDELGYYQASPALQRTPAAAEVHQGALEGSNVSSIDEMVALIQNQRAFEATAQTVRMISQTYERLNSFR